MNIAPEQVPRGWTNDPDLLRQLFHPRSEETYLARSCGLTDFKPLLTNTGDTGEMGYIFQSGDNYYWSDFMIDHLFLITKPKTLPDILRTLDTRDIQGLNMREMKQVVFDDEEDQEDEELREPSTRKNLFTPIGRNAPAI